MRKLHLLLTLSMLLCFFTTGCTTRNNIRSFLREEVDLGYVQHIAVLPFANPAKDDGAAARARDLTITQVLSQNLFDVVDKGLVDSALHEEALTPNKAIDTLTLKRLSQRLNVEAFLLGSVDHAAVNRLGASSFQEISLTMRLIDAKTGLVLWQASGNGSGYSVIDRLFGLNPSDSFSVTMDLIDELLASVPRVATR